MISSTLFDAKEHARTLHRKIVPVLSEKDIQEVADYLQLVYNLGVVDARAPDRPGVFREITQPGDKNRVWEIT